MPCRIEILESELSLRIGCTEQERREPQPVLLRALVSRSTLFEAARTDRVADTIDAARLRELLVGRAAEARVETLERLAMLLERSVREEFAIAGCEWEVALTKPRMGWGYVCTWTT